MNLCKIGDTVLIRNSQHGIIECPIIYVGNHFIIVKSKFYNMTINIHGKNFNRYINEMNEFLMIKKKRKEIEDVGVYSERIG